jgi:hypothetical protein
MIEALYDRFVVYLHRARAGATPLLRRLVRFAALPWCYSQVNWDECEASRWQVAKDFAYIFFVLRYFPDNYSQCRFWEKSRSEWKYYYGSIYDPYQRAALRKEVQPADYIVLFDDKEVCNQLCEAAELPVPNVAGFLDKTPDQLERLGDLVDRAGGDKLIVKPVRGKGGHGIFVAWSEAGRLRVKAKDPRAAADVLHIESRSIVQSFVAQHAELEKIAANSINTIRIQTLQTRGDEILIVGAMIRFGVDDAVVDNLSSGGIGVGIDIDTGKLMERAQDFASRTYRAHPNSGVEFLGYQVPMWPEVVDLARRIQQCFPYYRFLGHDIAITPDGPVIIEINPEPDNVMMEQCYGPILADADVLREFRDYGLLINRALS